MSSSVLIFQFASIHFGYFRITRSLPAGRGFVCLDVRELPQILKQIFASSVLHQSNSLNR